ncbi:hypothetical protein LVJ94_04625 [Pendulispora rubella]|uniref:Uncharacterized protein n=1 Tax=Pendulispora rubella TaxID=2741070 RepID=A0ABZ2L6M4_9BACT
MLVFAVTAACTACGGEPKLAVSPPPSSVDAGASAAAPSAQRYPYAASSVPMATMPPPFQYGSRKAEKKSVPAAAGCRDALGTGSGDLATQVQKVAKSCSEKMRAVAGPTAGTQTPGAPAQNIKLKAESGRCYRVVAAAAPTVKSLVVVVTDSTGAVAWESRTEEPRLVAPEDGNLCFKAADDAQVTVSVGSGEGAYAVQILVE